MPPTSAPSFLDQFILHLAAELVGVDALVRHISPLNGTEKEGIDLGGRGSAGSGDEQTRKRPRSDMGAASSELSGEVPTPCLYWRTPLLDISSNGLSKTRHDYGEALFVDLSFGFVRDATSTMRKHSSSSSLATSSVQEPRADIRLGILIRRREGGAEYFRSAPLTIGHLNAYAKSINVVLDMTAGARPVAKLLAGALKLLGRRSNRRASSCVYENPAFVSSNRDARSRKMRVDLYHPELLDYGVLAASSDVSSSSGGQGEIGSLALEMILANLRREDAERAERERCNESANDGGVVSDLPNNPYNSKKNEASELEEREATERLEAAIQTWWHSAANGPPVKDKNNNEDVGNPTTTACGTNKTSTATEREYVVRSGSLLAREGTTTSGEEGHRGVIGEHDKKRSGTPPMVPSPVSSPSKLTQQTQSQASAGLSSSQGSMSSRKAKAKKPSSAVYVRQRGRGFNTGTGGKKKRGAVSFGKIN